ncbi:MAG: hypothetical protein COA69_04250 [Robiginitomaculum sp.]|nr:MAG: hypothetical protein COA69_04250 [Robiginitomaculum sp.]
MSDLILLIGETEDQPWDWALSGTDTYGQALGIDDKSALSTLKYDRLIAVIPGMQVVAKLHTLETLNEKQKRQAAGFSIEDELAAPLGATHIAFDSKTARLLVIAKQTLAKIVTDLETAGLSPDIVCADYDMFEEGAEFSYNERVVQSGINGLGFAIETELALHILDGSQTLPASLSGTQVLRRIMDSLRAGHMPVNLRQGEFVKRSSLAGSGAKRIGWLAAACILAFVTLNIGQGLVYAQKTKAAKTEMDKIFVELFPDSPKPANPVVSVLRAQAENKAVAGEEFIRLSTILAASVKQVEGVEIVSLGYDEGRGQLSLSVLYNSFDDVERLKTVIATHGGVFTESGTRQNDTGLAGDAILRGAS